MLFIRGACSTYEHCIKTRLSVITSQFCFMIQVGRKEDYIWSSPHKRSSLRHSNFTCHFSYLSTLFTFRSNMVPDTIIRFIIHEVRIKIVVMSVEASRVGLVLLSTAASILAASLWLHWLILQEFWALSATLLEWVWESQHPA